MDKAVMLLPVGVSVMFCGFWMLHRSEILDKPPSDWSWCAFDFWVVGSFLIIAGLIQCVVGTVAIIRLAQ